MVTFRPREKINNLRLLADIFARIRVNENVGLLQVPEEAEKPRPAVFSWVTSRVPLGQVSFPSRVRVECHSAQQQREPGQQNVECRLDEVRLEKCAEEEWQAGACTGRQTKRYLCRKGDQQQCIDHADLCDWLPECEGAEDEDDALHGCEQVSVNLFWGLCFNVPVWTTASSMDVI